MKFSTLFAFFCFFVLVMITGVSAKEGLSPASLYTDVLRLHVIANSDSTEDQQLKFKVRDGILGVTEEIFGDCKNADDALKTAEQNKELLADAAMEVLQKNGSTRKASVLVGKETYPEKAYGNLTFPKGEYLSVRVVIGDGKGKNWWCVLFPPLCNVGVEEGDKVLVKYGINQEEIEKLKNKNQKGIEVFGCKITLKIFDLFD